MLNRQIFSQLLHEPDLIVIMQICRFISAPFLHLFALMDKATLFLLLSLATSYSSKQSQIQTLQDAD